MQMTSETAQPLQLTRRLKGLKPNLKFRDTSGPCSPHTPPFCRPPNKLPPQHLALRTRFRWPLPQIDGCTLQGGAPGLKLLPRRRTPLYYISLKAAEGWGADRLEH